MAEVGSLGEDELRRMCFFCFEVLEARLTGVARRADRAPAFRDTPHPLFVTWDLESKPGGDARLRGCIGTFQAQSLHRGLAQYALTRYGGSYTRRKTGPSSSAFH